MNLPIKIITPNTEQLARGTAVNMAFRFGMPTGQPLKVSDIVRQQNDPNFNHEEYMGMVVSEQLTLMCTDTTKPPPYKEHKFTFNECLIMISQPKNIVTTPMQGRNGTVKEYIADDDYQISLQAAVDNYLGNELTDERFDYPKTKVKELIEILKLLLELIVLSEFLAMFNANSVVVKEFSLFQETHSNRQSVNIELLSDEPYEIKLKPNNI